MRDSYQPGMIGVVPRPVAEIPARAQHIPLEVLDGAQRLRYACTVDLRGIELQHRFGRDFGGQLSALTEGVARIGLGPVGIDDRSPVLVIRPGAVQRREFELGPEPVVPVLTHRFGQPDDVARGERKKLVRGAEILLFRRRQRLDMASL